ncbi:MAG TPA: hypothetical protein VH760_01950 [Gaiellaceae bacterium]|jgi:uncharacterized repeat protein (TIGR01451 family)
MRRRGAVAGVTRVAALALVLSLAAFAGVALAAGLGSTQDPQVKGGQSVTICHATGNGKYNQISPDVSSIVGDKGHGSHDEDIIPPFEYESGSYPGKNWDETGQATWENGCVATTPPPTTTTPPPPKCTGELTATNASGQGSQQQYVYPDKVYVKGKEFPPSTTLSYTVTHKPQNDATVVASGSFNSGSGTFGPILVWDGHNAFPGDEGYRVEVRWGDCSTGDNFQYRASGGPPQQPKLRVRKVVVGSAKPASDFSFSVNGQAIPFEADGENELSLPPGTYTVTESPTGGFTTTTSGCTNVVLSTPQQTVPTCTITNTAVAPTEQPKLRVRKVVVGSMKPPSDFSFTVNGQTIPFEADGENELSLPAGTYTITEPPTVGFATTSSGCTNVVLSTPQQTIPTCTITNTAVTPPVQPKLRVRKVVVGSDTPPSDFSFTVNGQTIPFEADGENELSLPAGTYTVAEPPTDGFTTTTAGCTDIVLAMPQLAIPTCTITNTAVPAELPKLRVRKVVVGSDKPPSDFSFTVNGQTTPFEADGENELGLPPGTYTVTEQPTDGFTSTLEGCTDVVLATPQQTVPTCTITNTAAAPPEQPKLRVRKVVVGSDTPPSDFSFTVNGQTTPFEADGENEVSLPAGTYTVTEPGTQGFETTTSGCTDVVLSTPQQTIPTCTITNTAVAPATFPIYVVTKCVDNYPGGGFSATFAYFNPNLYPTTVDVGPSNSVSPSGPDRGQPTTFQPGIVGAAFTVGPEPDGTEITWQVANTPTSTSTATATADTATKCSKPPEPPKPKVTLFVQCVDNGTNTFDATFGYENEDAQPVSIPIGPQNRFTPDPEDRNQPIEFGRGRVEDAVTVKGVANGTSLVWTIDTGETTSKATATAAFSTKCGTTPPEPPDPPPTPLPVRIFVSCVTDGGTTYAARFGYDNANDDTVEVDVGAANRFFPAPQNRGQTTRFGAGHVDAAFTVSGIPNGTNLVWALTYAGATRTATAGADFATKCTGPPPPPPPEPPPPPPEPPPVPPLPPDPTREAIGVFVTCVVDHGKTYDAVFGYQNDNEDVAQVSVGIANRFQPVPVSRGQVTEFLPGNVQEAFRVLGVARGTDLTWTVRYAGAARSATASADLPERCAGAPEPLRPIGIFACVQSHGSSYDVVFGYENDNPVDIPVPVGSSNFVLPRPADRGQPALFRPGRQEHAFVVRGVPNSKLVAWTVSFRGTRSVLVNATYPVRCGTEPPSQVRLFPLCVRNTGTTYTAVFGYLNLTPRNVIVPLGSANRVTPAPPNRGQPEVFRPGIAFASFAVRRVPAAQRLVWKVAAGGRVDTATAHARLGRKCLTTAPDATPDVSILKTVKPAVVDVGDRATFTLRVRNDGTGYALAVTVIDRPLGDDLQLLSATASQGRCGLRGENTSDAFVICFIGNLPPGGSATVVVATRARSPGQVRNRATVHTVPQNIARAAAATVVLNVRGAAAAKPPPKPKPGAPPFTG